MLSHDGEAYSARRGLPPWRLSRCLALCACASSLVLLSGACTKPSSETREERAPSSSAVARLSLGTTRAQALQGGTPTFVLESTPDLVLHADLPASVYENASLLIQGTNPGGAVVWSYPHLQKGSSFDAVLPVFGSRVAREHVAGAYSIQVLGPGRVVVESGVATFTSTRGG